MIGWVKIMFGLLIKGISLMILAMFGMIMVL
jgi:hypothetical protein